MKKRAACIGIFLLLITFVGTGNSLSRIDEIELNGLTRFFLVHTPPAYDGSAALPLIIALHGGLGSAENLQRTSLLNAKADTSAFIVVYPEGVRRLGIRTWNAGGCCGHARDNHIDDVGFIDALLDTLLTRYKIDERRIYATGISNGGMMAYRLACELPDRIAAVAPVAATMVASECKPHRAVPILHLHSFLDSNVPHDGGVGDGISRHYNPPLDSVLSTWAEKNECAVEPDTVHNDNDFLQVVWQDCANESGVELYLSQDGGHSWPGGMRAGWPGADPPSEVLDGNELMWTFFQAYPMPSTPTAVGQASNPLVSFAVSHNYPNPFNPQTAIDFSFPNAQHVRLQVFNSLGRRITTLLDEMLPSGRHTVTWRANGNASGIYYFRLEAGDFKRTLQVTLIK